MGGRRNYKRSGAPFKKLETAVSELVSSWGYQKKLNEYKAIEAWKEVAGERIAARTQPKEVRNGILFVATVSATWAEELSFLRKKLCREINERLGKKTLSDIRFQAGGCIQREEEHDEREEGPQEKLSLEQLGEIRSLVKHISDGDLRQKMKEFLIRDALLKQRRASKKET